MKVGVIGCGTMGSGIAQVAARAGCQVVVYDTRPEALTESKSGIRRILNRLVEKGKLHEDKKEAILSNIRYAGQLDALATADLVIEAIVEDPDSKRKTFGELEGYVSEACTLASNTSSLSIASLAAALRKPERFIGIHFFNPAPLMKLVEIVPSVQTDPDIIRQTRSIIEDWEKITVLARDTPGFIVNKVARPFYSEALRIYEEGIADFATIDWAMKAIGGFRMGPFELMDFIGNDINYTVTETVFKAFYYDPRYKPALTQKRLTEAGYYGRKTGKGYYDYTETAARPQPEENDLLGRQITDRIITMLINEAADTVQFRIASKEDIDLAMTKGVNYPKGLLQWADEIGIGTVVERLDKLYEEYHEDRYRCSALLRKMARQQLTFFDRPTHA